MRTQEIREMEKRVEMYRRLLIWNIVFLLGLLCWGSVRGQSGVEFIPSSHKIIGNLKQNIGFGNYSIDPYMLITKDSNILVSNDSTIQKFDKNLNLLWTINVQGCFINHMSNTIDNQIVGVGTGLIQGIPSGLRVFKLDNNGNLLWYKSYLTALKSEGNSKIIALRDSSFVIGCHSNSGISTIKSTDSFGSYDIWALKLNKNGDKIWDMTYGGNNVDLFANILAINDSMYFLSGNSYSNASGNKTTASGAWLLTINKNGTIKKQISGNEFTRIRGDKAYLTSDLNIIYTYVANKKYVVIKLDTNLNQVWRKEIDEYQIEMANVTVGSDIFKMDNNYILSYGSGVDQLYAKIDENGNILEKEKYINIQPNANDGAFFPSLFNFQFLSNSAYLLTASEKLRYNPIYSSSSKDSLTIVKFKRSKSKIRGSFFPDFNSNCFYNKSSEYNIPKITIHNKTENTYAITNDSIYTMYLFDRDTAVLKVINLDSNLFVSCGKDSIVVDMTGKTDTSGIDFPIRSNKTGHCINITSFSSGLLRPGRWGDYQLNYQNNAFDTAYNAFIEIEVDTAAIDSIKSPYSFTLTGTILRFNLGHVRPFGFSSLTYSIKLKTTVIIGSSHCHRAKVFPICNLYPSAVYDSSEIQPMMRCLPNDTVEFTLKNIGIKDQKDWGHSIIYVDELILKKDSFKLTVGNSRVFKYKLNTNTVFTAEVFNSNYHPVTPILIRHNDLCANKRPMIPQNAALNFSRHDEAKEYEEACTIVRGSYDPNIKSVQPVGMFAEHYTSTGTELKYRIDFQNTGTDTAFRVVLVDTLSSFLDIASFVPGVSSHPYSVEFGGRAIKFIFDPISLIDSGTNEPASHGYVHFKIKHIAGISPKTKIENKADIYFDYNAPIRTNTVFNTIFDTIQIYVPKASDTTKGKDSTNSIQAVNQTSILVFPNPTTDKFFIQMSEPVLDLSIEMYDIQGRLIKTVSSSNNQTVEVSAQGMTKGIYHIRCMSGVKVIVVKKVMVE